MSLIIPESVRPYTERHRGADWDEFPVSLLEDYDQLAPYLPPAANRILDIGCGMAGIDVLLKQRYPAAELWLLDGDGDDERAGWNKRLEAFSSRQAADELLAANGCKADRWIDVNTKEALVADLVISLASWGYHYPLNTYNVTGYCIADLRTSQEPPRGKVIQSYAKRNRCAWHQGQA